MGPLATHHVAAGTSILARKGCGQPFSWTPAYGDVVASRGGSRHRTIPSCGAYALLGIPSRVLRRASPVSVATALSAHGVATAASSLAPLAGEPLLTIDGVSKSHDGLRTLFDGVSFTLSRGERLAVVGANGSGKTSLLRLLAGTDETDGGNITARRGIQISYLTQEAELPEGSTVSALDAVVASDSPVAVAVREYTRLLSLGAAVDRAALGEATARMDALGGWQLEADARAALADVGLPSPSMRVAEMSGGQRRKVAVAAALLGSADIVILDEPTNHMDVQFIEWMTATLTTGADAMRRAVVLVTHDRAFLEAVSTRILELDAGRGHMHEIGSGAGTYARFLDRRAERRAAQEAAAQDARVVLRRESEWMARQPKARGTKSRARVEAFEALQATARSGPALDHAVDFGAVRMARQGKKVLVMQDVRKDWQGVSFIRDFSYDFTPGERLGIVGPNGTGKSTLLGLIAGTTAPDAGTRDVGDTTVIGHFAQHPEPVGPRLRVIDYVSAAAEAGRHREGSGVEVQPARMLDMLGFPFKRHADRVGSLSGGERRRVHLAAVLARRPNFLLLDEPTNDLDLTTIEAVEGLLRGYRGAALVVSHDAAFMDNVVDSLFILDGSGAPPRRVDQKYSQYLADIRIARRATVGGSADPAGDVEGGNVGGSGSSGQGGGSPVDVEEAGSATASAGGTSSSATPPRPLRRLGFREKEEYVRLEGEIDGLSARRVTVEGAISKAAEAGDFAEVQSLSEELAKLSTAIDRKTDRWLDLAERAEAAGTV